VKPRQIVLATAFLLVCGFGAAQCVIRPLVVTSRYKAFVREHPAGMTARELAAAPFVEEAELVDVLDGPSDAGAGFVAQGAAFALRSGDRKIAKSDAVAKASGLAEGAVTFGWTTLRPFGRELFSAQVHEGRLTQIETHTLD
jgi:hypothetical protein